MGDQVLVDVVAICADGRVGSMKVDILSGFPEVLETVRPSHVGRLTLLSGVGQMGATYTRVLWRLIPCSPEMRREPFGVWYQEVAG